MPRKKYTVADALFLFLIILGFYAILLLPAHDELHSSWTSESMYPWPNHSW